MSRRLLACFAALCVFAAHAQDPQKPAAGAETPAAAPAKPEPVPGQEPDPKIVEDLFTCVAEGLPVGWKKAWFVVREIGRSNDKDGTTRRYVADFAYAKNAADRKGLALKPCGPERVIQGVASLNEYLTESQRAWTSATFTFYADGKYDAKYDYTPLKKPAAKPAAKSAAKKAEPKK